MNAAKSGRKKLLTMILALTLLAGIFGSSLTAYTASAPVKITVIHTNDVHSRVGVEPYVAGLVNEKKAAGENVLVLSAGDVLHGQPLATLSRGRNIVDIMNAVGYDAMVPGNHDFNYGFDRLKMLQNRMNFPVLGANVKTVNGRDALTPYVIKEVGGVKVGIFGLATPETKTKTNPKNVADIDFKYPVSVARETVRTLKSQGCKVVIALTHLGDDEETWKEERSAAVAQIEGIDLIIDGHSHSVWENGLDVNGVLLAQTGSYGENIGVVELKVSGGKVRSKTASLMPVPTAEKPNPALTEDAKVKSLIARLEKANQAITAEVIGKTPVLLQGEREFVRTQETNLGNLITDAMRHASGADIALTNGGGIRASIPAGDITKGDVLTVLPFGNYVVTKNMSGKAIKEALEHGLTAYPETAGGFPHVSGIKFTFNPSAAPGNRVTSITLSNGQPLNPDKFYTLATNDFMAAGGDGYTMIGESAGETIYSSLDEAVIAYLQTNPEISATAEGRIVPRASAQKAA